MTEPLEEMDLPNLAGAEVGQEELNPLAFNPDDYADISQIIERVLSSDERQRIDLTELSKNGTCIQDPMSDYLAAKKISGSAVKEALKTPLHYYYYIHQELPKKPKEAFDLGTFCHLAFLEPEKFDKVVVEPNHSLTSGDGVSELIKFWEQHTKISLQEKIKSELSSLSVDLTSFKGKKEYYRVLVDRSGIEIVDETHATIIRLIKNQYYRYGGGIIPMLLKGSLSEVSMYGKDPETGLDVKIRPDSIQIEENIGANAIISFKTTRADNLQKFFYDCAAYKYELSEGMYQKVATSVTGRKFNCTIMVMLQTVPPYLPAVLFWDAEDLQVGKHKYDMAMQTILETREKGVYPGFDSFAESGNCGIIPMKLPQWISKDLLPIDIDE